MISAAILAGGSGSRMGGTTVPKQFLNIEAKPVLIRTVAVFLASAQVDQIVIAVAKDWLDYAEDLIHEAFGETGRVFITVGGSDRLASLMNICAFIADRFPVGPADIIVTHDAARPFVTERMITDSIKMLSFYDGVTTVYPAVDTVLVSANGETVDAIPPRQTMFAVQTPQTFHTGELIEAISSLTEAERVSLTDAAKIFLLKGKSVGMVKGDVTNMKLTTNADLKIAAFLIRAGDGKKEDRL